MNWTVTYFFLSIMVYSFAFNLTAFQGLKLRLSSIRNVIFLILKTYTCFLWLKTHFLISKIFNELQEIPLLKCHTLVYVVEMSNLFVIGFCCPDVPRFVGQLLFAYFYCSMLYALLPLFPTFFIIDIFFSSAR